MDENKYIKNGIVPGEVTTLKVVRESEIGAFLDAKTGSTSDDILLHKQQQLRPVAIGEELEVYLYLDPKKRVAASMRLPNLKLGEIGPAKLMGITRQGAFVDLGAERGVFLPYREMQGKPLIGETIWVKPYRDKSGRIAVTMSVDEGMVERSTPSTFLLGDDVEVLVWRDGEQGYSGISEAGVLAFIHHDEVIGKIAVGDTVTGRVSFLREDGRINLSLRPVKEIAIDLDGEKIIQYLESRNGQSMPYGDDTPPEIIKEKFALSKAAFKRALGRLMKDGRVRFEDEWTVLVDKQSDLKS